MSRPRVPVPGSLFVDSEKRKSLTRVHSANDASIKRPSFIERKSTVLPMVDMPPLMVQKVQEVSEKFGGVIFAFRGNASLPMYMTPSAPKPSSIKAKTCKRKGFAEGAIPEIAASVVLGNIAADEKGVRAIQTYKAKDLEHPPGSDRITTPTVQLDYTPRQIMEGLHSGRYQMVGFSPEGQLRVKEATDAQIHGGVIYGINFADASKPPLAGIKHEDWRVTSKLPTPVQPAWWDEKFGNWSIQVENRYPSYYQENEAAPLKPLMVYGRDSDMGVLPITGDQDLLWMSIPVECRDTFKLSDTVFQPINTFLLGDIKKNLASGSQRMFEQLMELSDHFENINRPDMSLSVLDIPDEVIAGMGIISPFEAYVAIFVNKELGKEASHVRNLIQHGCDNRNPGNPSSLDDKINHVGGGFKHQTRDAKELASLASSANYSGKNIIDIHPGWGMEMLQLVKAQVEVRKSSSFASLPDAVTDKFSIERDTLSKLRL